MDCVICGAGASSYVAIDPSHLTPRRRGGCDHPDCVLPMCRHLGDPSGCHELYERGELDLLSIVISESWPAYRSEVQHVLEHLTPVEMVEQLAGARTQWSDMSGGAA
jgi:hypothetical protein